MEVIREAIILAAGEGSRLKKISKGMPKFMINIAGKPLIYYTMSILDRLGITSVKIVVQKKWRNLAEEILDKYATKAKITCIENNHVEKDNGYSFLLAKDFVNEAVFLLLMSDHIFSTDFIETFVNLVRMPSENEEETKIFIAGDRTPRFINVSEATKIHADNENRVIRIGKNIEPFNFIDTGLFVIKKDIYELLDVDALSQRDFIKFADIIMDTIDRKYVVKVIDVNSGLWTEIDTPLDYQELLYGKRKVILEQIQRQIQGGEHV
ncbi:MAG: NTP transferase domain-containing protein [Candidatus Odinarchaeota archaeon]|nr:NTP transferase domain-containing protein [Candidatus Odinarchaeota archaeon]